MNLAYIIKKHVVTEKSQRAFSNNNEYVFEVDRRANKIEIRKAVEEMFSVKVADVRTSILKPLILLKKGKHIKTSKIKKAVVKLMEGNTLGIF